MPETASCKLGLEIGRQDGPNLPRQSVVRPGTKLVLQLADSRTQGPIRRRVADRIQIRQAAFIQLRELDAAATVNEDVTQPRPARRRTGATARPAVDKRPQDTRCDETLDDLLPTSGRPRHAAPSAARTMAMLAPRCPTHRGVHSHPPIPGGTRSAVVKPARALRSRRPPPSRPRPRRVARRYRRRRVPPCTPITGLTDRARRGRHSAPRDRPATPSHVEVANCNEVIGGVGHEIGSWREATSKLSAVRGSVRASRGTRARRACPSRSVHRGRRARS
jgi:hypothetical protein